MSYLPKSFIFVACLILSTTQSFGFVTWMKCTKKVDKTRYHLQMGFTKGLVPILNKYQVYLKATESVSSYKLLDMAWADFTNKKAKFILDTRVAGSLAARPKVFSRGVTLVVYDAKRKKNVSFEFIPSPQRKTVRTTVRDGHKVLYQIAFNECTTTLRESGNSNNKTERFLRAMNDLLSDD